MEGRITTPPTTSGVQKRAGQSKAEGIWKPNKAKPLGMGCNGVLTEDVCCRCGRNVNIALPFAESALTLH
jgi:hypothetical protein